MGNTLLKPLVMVRKIDQFLYCGMDIHKDNHTACLVNCFGQILLEKEIEDTKESFKQLVKQVLELLRINKAEKVVFGLEDSYGNGLRLATYLQRKGFKVKTISPVLVDRERKYETHPEKSDSLDALGVAKVLIQKIDSLPNYSIALQDKLSKEIKELTLDRQFLVKEQTRLKNQIHYLLHKTYGSMYKKLFKGIFSSKALKYWHRYPIPSKFQEQELILHPATLKNQIRRKIKRLYNIKQELKEIDQELSALIEITEHKITTLPGCNTVLAAQVLAEVRNIDRFKSADSLAKYAGLSPREKSSGKNRRQIKTHSGNRRLNLAIHRIALSQIAVYGNEHAKGYFQRKVSEGKSKLQALHCLKRRLVDIIFMMLKNRAKYNYHGATI